MFVSFLSNNIAVIAPLGSAHFTASAAQGCTAIVDGKTYHPVDPKSIQVHELGGLSKTIIDMAEKARVASFGRG